MEEMYGIYLSQFKRSFEKAFTDDPLIIGATAAVLLAAFDRSCTLSGISTIFICGYCLYFSVFGSDKYDLI